MATQNANTNTLKREWFVVDASDVILGRLATRVATVLRGKHKPTFTPHVDCGDFVIVTNAKQVKISGNKEQQKQYWRHTGFPGGIRSTVLAKQREEHPERIIMNAVKGMLPRGPLGRQMLKKLKVYVEGTHEHQAQSPKELNLKAAR